MGVVIKQSIQNTVTTYLGFLLGGINILFLYTKILDPQYYGLVTFMLATGAILMPIMALGAHNTLVKFYSEQEEGNKDSFLTLILLSPLIALVPLACITYFSLDSIAGFIATKNHIAGHYVWYIFLIGLAMAYFEIFFAWCKVHLKSAFGNFMKEVFVRLCTTILLVLLYYEIIDLDFFLKALVGTYLLRTIAIKLYAYSLRRPKLNFKFPKQSKIFLTYSVLMILGGSAALILLEIDKFMINQFVTIENVAFYGVAVYIATVIIVPSRAMHQITYPLTAELFSKNDFKELNTLYKKTSLNLFIASGLVFLLIVLNLNDLYQLLPKEYGNGFYIVFLIGLAKVFDSLLGNINSILYNSKYYKTILLLGVLLAITTIVLNLWLIPLLGIEGAALASFSAIFLFNLIKMGFVKQKFGFWPFTNATFKVLLVLLLIGFLFSALNFPFHPIVNILLKSLILSSMYFGIIHRMNVSEDISLLVSKVLNRKK